MAAQKSTRIERWVLSLCLLGGILLTVIGIRYFVLPESAARTFGVPGRAVGNEFHYIIGLRNVWLGLLAMVLSALREWRALALWFSLGTIVCFADAAIAASSTGRLPQVAFHVVCGCACAVLTIVCWRVAGRQR